MTAVVETARYIDRKTHECGCVTVWDTVRDVCSYSTACGVHRPYWIAVLGKLSARDKARI